MIELYSKSIKVKSKIKFHFFQLKSMLVCMKRPRKMIRIYQASTSSKQQHQQKNTKKKY